MFLKQPLDQAGPAAYSPLDQMEIILTAAGFTLGFGWLWFPFLAAHWLPAFLWGGPLSGGGASLFIALLVGGFLLVWLILYRKSEPVTSFSEPAGLSAHRRPARHGRLAESHLAHGLALLVAALEIVSAQALWAAPPSLRILLLAVAALSMGIFWGGRLLSLNPDKAGWTMAAAGTMSLLLALALTFYPLSPAGCCLALPLSLAWLTSWGLYRLQRLRPEPKRPRGRPPKKTEAENRPGVPGPGKFDLSLMILALYLTSLNEASGPSLSAGVWAARIMTLTGAAGTMFMFRHAVKVETGLGDCKGKLNPGPLRIILCLALALMGAGHLMAAGLFCLPAKFLTGAIGLIITLLLAGAPLQFARGRAAAALALTLVLSNAGPETAAGLKDLLSKTSATPLISEPAVRLPGLITLLTALILWALAAGPRPGNNCSSEEKSVQQSLVQSDGTPAYGPTKNEVPGLNRSSCPLVGREPPEPAIITAGSPDPGLTSREEEIVGLAARGCGNRQIAEQLSIQEATVRFHLRNIYKKTGLKNRKELLACTGRLAREETSKSKPFAFCTIDKRNPG